MEENEFFYILLTDTIPKTEYPLIGKYILREANYRKRLRENSSLIERMERYNRYISLPFLDENTFQIYRDLVLFHSFLSGNTISYEYGEQSENISIESSAISFPDCDESSNTTANKFLDFDHFQVDAKLSWDNDPYLEAEVNYRKAFSIFQNLKNKKGLIKLYNLINLWVFATGYQSLTRIYTNTNLAITFYITILEALIERPVPCKNKTEICRLCGRTGITHDSTTRKSLFISHYGEKFLDLMNIRHGTIHEGNYDDLILKMFEDSNISNENNNWDNLKQFDTLEETARYYLLRWFLEQYKLS